MRKASNRSKSMRGGETYDVVCLSHLRLDFVWQRPQQLLSRCAAEHRVFFVEEAVFGDDGTHLVVREDETGVTVVQPHLRAGLSLEEMDAAQKELLDGFLREHGVRDYVLWFYAPMAAEFTRHLSPLATV